MDGWDWDGWMVIIEVVGLFRASSVPIMLIMMMMGAREDRQGKGATVGHCGREGRAIRCWKLVSCQPASL